MGGSAGGLLSCACVAQNEGSKPELWLAWPCWSICSTRRRRRHQPWWTFPPQVVLHSLSWRKASGGMVSRVLMCPHIVPPALVGRTLDDRHSVLDKGFQLLGVLASSTWRMEAILGSSLDSIRLPRSSSLGMVTDFFGATLALAATRITVMVASWWRILA